MAFIYSTLLVAMKYKVAINLIPCTIASDNIILLLIFTQKRRLYSPYGTSTVWCSVINTYYVEKNT